MNLWILSSKPCRFWIRFPVFWTVLFLAGCFYILHFRRTAQISFHHVSENSNYENGEKSKRSHVSKINTSKGIFVEGEDIYNRTDKHFDETEDDNIFNDENDGVTSTGSMNKNALSSFEIEQLYNIMNSSHKPINDDTSQPNILHSLSHSKINKYAPTYGAIIRESYEKSKPYVNKIDNQDLPPYLRLWNVHWTVRLSGMIPKSMFSPKPMEYPKQRLPKGILIGAGKCGTRALIEFLGMHPYIVTARDEVHYFDIDRNFANGLDWYVSRMPLSFGNQLTVEKSPSYLWSDRAVEEIYKLDKDMRLLVILKDPVVRVVSQAIRTRPTHITDLFLIRNEKGEFRVRENSKTVMWSIYVNYLKKWFKKFSQLQIHIVEAKELAADPAAEVQKIESFLGVPSRIKKSNFYFNKTKGFHCMKPLHLTFDIVCLSEGKGKQHPKLEPWQEKLLYDYYRPYNEELFSLLGRRFDWNPPGSTVNGLDVSELGASNLTEHTVT